jgi:hypothetical protein
MFFIVLLHLVGEVPPVNAYNIVLNVCQGLNLLTCAVPWCSFRRARLAHVLCSAARAELCSASYHDTWHLTWCDWHWLL